MRDKYHNEIDKDTDISFKENPKCSNCKHLYISIATGSNLSFSSKCWLYCGFDIEEKGIWNLNIMGQFHSPEGLSLPNSCPRVLETLNYNM